MTTTSPLISVPKKITQDVDFAPHLKTVISRSYSESPDAYADELALLNRSRQDALRGSAGSDVTARDLLYKYFGQLELLELRFPELRVPFPWNDAFTQVKISQLSLAYEKASVIFNIGATLSSLAASSPRSSPEGLKRAFLSFRCASGMFTYINDNFLHAPSTDLSRDVVKVLVGLMGAQATEVFIETMPVGVKSAGLRSKMCMQASSLYASIIEETKEWVNKGVFIREWSHLIQCKAKYFASLAQYHRSIADTSAGKYGEALARLTLAESLGKEALRLAHLFNSTFSTAASASSLAPDAPGSMLELAKNHSNLMTETKTKAQKDNDLVYNEVVPSEASLAPIDKGKEVAEPIAIHDVYATPDVQKVVGPDLFSRLVPLSVHESASMYSEEKAKLARAEGEKVDLADGELVAALEYMGLPASLDRFRQGAAGQDSLTDPGPQVRAWAAELRQGDRVEDLLGTLHSLKDKSGSLLASTAQALEVESRECEGMRVRFGHLWEQAPSAGLTRSFRQDLASHRMSLEQAAASDAQAEGIWNPIREDAALLVEPSGQALERAFVEAVGSSDAGQPNLLDTDFGEDEDEEVKKRVASIAEGLIKVNKIKKERTEVFKDLKERIQGDDISHLLILNRKGSASVEPALFATELEKFRPHQARITATVQHQQTALAEISADFKALTESKKAREVQIRWATAERKKQELIGRLQRAYAGYVDVREGAQKGVQFYRDLSGLVESLQQQVNAFVRSRETERNQMASTAALKQRLEGPPAPSPLPLPGSPPTLDQRMGSLHLDTRSPPPVPPQQWQPPPTSYAPTPTSQTQYPPAPPSQPSYTATQSQAPYSPASPYANLPSSGPFSMAPPSQSYSSPPPPPPNPYASSQSPYGAQGPRPPPSFVPAPTQYGQPPQQQASYPAPPQPQRQASASFLPPPPTPISYSYQSAPQMPPPSQPLQQQPPYGANTPNRYQSQQPYGYTPTPPQPPRPAY